MARIEVKYNADEFVTANFGCGIESAKEYVKEHPKDSYGADDFAEVYRMQESKRMHKRGDPGAGWINTRGWDEEDPSFDMVVKAYESEVL